MANSTKITFTANPEIKDILKSLKEEYGFKSISAVIEDAIKKYKEEKEVLKWEKGAQIAANDEEYQKFCQEWSSDVGGLHEY